MKPLTIADAPTMILALQDEIRRPDESWYDHRLHGVLLVAHGLTCLEAALRRTVVRCAMAKRDILPEGQGTAIAHFWFCR